jgi:hypothetical protein
MPGQFDHSPQGVFAILSLLVKGVHQQTAVPCIRRLDGRRRGQPVGLGEILEKLRPFDGVAGIDIDFLEEPNQFIADKVVAGVVVEGLAHEPHELEQVESVIVVVELLLDEVDAGVVQRHHDVTHVVAVLTAHRQLLLLPQVTHHRLKRDLRHYNLYRTNYHTESGAI